MPGGETCDGKTSGCGILDTKRGSVASSPLTVTSNESGVESKGDTCSYAARDEETVGIGIKRPRENGHVDGVDVATTGEFIGYDMTETG